MIIFVGYKARIQGNFGGEEGKGKSVLPVNPVVRRDLWESLRNEESELFVPRVP